MRDSKIEWTGDTDNIFVVMGPDGKQLGWYCQKVSPGCANCYAERINMDRFGNGLPYRAPKDGQLPPMMFRRDLVERWKRQTKPKLHFVNSTTDTFGEFIPEEWIFEALDGMAAAPRQTLQLLTKRAERMADLMLEWLRRRGMSRVPDNIWPGVSVENQKMAEKRMPSLVRIPASTRFVSAEPLLERVDLSPWLMPEDRHESHGIITGDPLVHLVIVGGESGPGARVMQIEDARFLRDQCVQAGVSFFFKQWGEWVPERVFETLGAPQYRYKVKHVGGVTGSLYFRVGRRFSGRKLDGREWNELPAWGGERA